MSKLLIEHRASVTLLTLNRPGSHDDFAEEQSSRAAAAAELYQVSEMRPR